jgi:hypothetical protein
MPIRPRCTIGALLFSLSCGLLGQGLPARGANPLQRVDFGRQIRPLLAEYCLPCHGPDEGRRQAELRLDTRTGALAPLESGARAVVPGRRSQSELYRRLVSQDPDLRMPPAELGKRPKKTEIELLGRWIDQGAGWEAHWAFEPPARPPLPQVSRRSWPRNPLDHFILSRLEHERLRPSPPADKARLLRRVTLVLTGLPPSPAEIDAFLADRAPGAYERVVDRLLDSPRFGEHMARHWLDLARYADTHGYHIDSHRDMWRWRDWVIDSYNQNQPFDQFTIEQLAGDLLPNASLDQKIASGFNRNNMLNFEAGALADEYLVEYVADRVVTTSTVWMAQTMQCSRCHDHKYDPYSQRDFFRLFAYFNNVPELGLDGRTGNAEPLIEAPTRLQQQQLTALREQLAQRTLALRQHAEQVQTAQRKWEQTLREGNASATTPATDMLVCLPLDETEGSVATDSVSQRKAAVIGPPLWLPGKHAGALLLGGTTHLQLTDVAAFDRLDSFSIGVWVYPTTGDRMTIVGRRDDVPAANQSPANDDADQADNPRGAPSLPGDPSLPGAPSLPGDPCDGRGYRVLLDEDHVLVELVHGAESSAIRVRSKRPLSRRQWQHLLVTYDGSGTAAGLSVYIAGVAEPLEVVRDDLDGSIASPRPLWIGGDADGSGFRGMLDDVRLYARRLSATEAAVLAGSDPIGQIAAIDPARRTEQQQSILRDYYLQHQDPEARRLRQLRDETAGELTAVERSVPTTMVMAESNPPRVTHVLLRGDYRYPAEQVTAGPPASLLPLPADAPPNRLGLARWLVDARHPLTARVAVNRYWQQCFGEGLVRTTEDFGTRGEPPSHPELLDWLADEFIRFGWDRKHMLRLIVTSATFRQSNRLDENLLRADPSNRLLARGPRTRLSGETIRDAALFSSGLLVERQGGPGVYPYQPKGLWKEVSFNPRDFTAQVYTPSVGADLYRRSIYTFWKRAAPSPPMVIFDAPDRETCVTRRPRTNTPLQALVLLNEPGFVEAARVLAERVLTEAPVTTASRLEHLFRHVLGRRPRTAELVVLRDLLEQQRAEFGQDSQAAAELLRVGQWSGRLLLDPLELASWTVVASVMLNLDETIHD